jgi:uncharacterized membrane protein YfcA
MIVALGLFGGLVIGATGIGGGTLMLPGLMLMLGLPPAEAVGTALVFSSAARLNAVLLYLRRKQVGFRALTHVLAGGIPGVIGGTVGMRWLRSEQASRGMAILGGVVIVSAGISLLRIPMPVGRNGDRPRLLAVCSFPIGLSVGFSSVGAGVLGTVALFNCTSLDPAAVVGTDLCFGFALSAVGGGLHLAAGSCEPALLVKLIVGGLAGATAGSYVAGVLPARALRTAVLAWAAVLGAILLGKGLGKAF